LGTKDEPEVKLSKEWTVWCIYMLLFQEQGPYIVCAPPQTCKTQIYWQNYLWNE